MSDPRISLIVAAYNMARELPRTIRSLSPGMQRKVCRHDYEIIVVDSGSTEPFDDLECRCWGADLRVLRFESSSGSPAAALNTGIAAARGELIGAFIDGARLASPGIVHLAWKASNLADRAVVATLGFHLGHEFQPLSVRRGYDEAAEDKLLQRSRWTEDGYRLFGISVFAGSSGGGWFAPLSESNGLFMHRSMWEELGGFEERFRSAGGGFVNLDLFARAVALPGAEVITLLGEGTFHQVHGGVATNGKSPQPQFRAEYRRIRGAPFKAPQYGSIYIGSVPATALHSVRDSAQMALDETATGRPARQTNKTGGMRKFTSDIPPSVLDTIQSGVLRTCYRGVPFLKSPFDVCLYLQLIGRLRPASVIEIGTKNGGSALWFADMLTLHGITPRVLSIDIVSDPSVSDDRIEFLEGDAGSLGDVLSPGTLESLPRPWLVVEDSAHLYETSHAVLQFFHPYLRSGDYIVIEDGVVAWLSAPMYRQFADGPNRAIADFLARHGKAYQVDAELCDFYGRNATYNPNGWLRRR